MTNSVSKRGRRRYEALYPLRHALWARVRYSFTADGNTCGLRESARTPHPAS